MLYNDGCELNNAPVAELADALDSGSSRGNSVQVQFLSGAPTKKPLLFTKRGFFVVFVYAGHNIVFRVSENII